MQVFTKDITEIYRLRIYIEYTYQDLEPSEVIGSVALENKIVLLADFVFLLVACNTDFSFYEYTA